MPTHPHKVGVTPVLKSSPACQKSHLFTHISTLQAGSSKIEQATLPKIVIKTIDTITLNIVVVTKALNFLWMSYKGAHWFTTRRQTSHIKSCVDR